MTVNLEGMPKIIDEYDKAGMQFNNYTNKDLQSFLDEFDNVANDHQEAVKMVILAIRKAKNDGKYSNAAIKNNVLMWANQGLKTAQEVGEFVKEQESKSKPYRYGQAKETRPDWEHQKGEPVSDEEIQQAIQKLADIRARRKERNLQG